MYVYTQPNPGLLWNAWAVFPRLSKEQEREAETATKENEQNSTVSRDNTQE